MLECSLPRRIDRDGTQGWTNRNGCGRVVRPVNYRYGVNAAISDIDFIGRRIDRHRPRSCANRDGRR